MLRVARFRFLEFGVLCFGVLGFLFLGAEGLEGLALRFFLKIFLRGSGFSFSC